VLTKNKACLAGGMPAAIDMACLSWLQAASGIGWLVGFASLASIALPCWPVAHCWLSGLAGHNNTNSYNNIQNNRQTIQNHTENNKIVFKLIFKLFKIIRKLSKQYANTYHVNYYE
jgi:hypothetical protein